MSILSEQLEMHMDALISEWIQSGYLQEDELFVIGCSTSEVAGESIGTSGSEEIAAIIFSRLQKLKIERSIHLVFQCCEHLNRALVVEKETMKTYGLREVSVIPIREAGGALASYAYKHFEDPVVIEEIQAHAGIDIGETMIGMQLRKVAVPLRFEQKTIGHARVTGARTRPKLIGGERARYTK
jgi:uncharacterized protein (TIGR01440 family)